MKYRVQWERQARDELGTSWLKADSALRRAITEAAHAIDQELSQDPFRSSESREAGRRVLIVAPLGVTFRVDEPDRVVYVLRLWSFTRRGKQ
jgi:hypothetical protein